MTLPDFIAPMLASPGDFFTSATHLYEMKWDGIRCLVFSDGQVTRLMSRNGRHITTAFPEFAAIANQFKGTKWVIDTELIALDAQGKPQFDLVRNRNLLTDMQKIKKAAQSHPGTLIAFDLLYLNDKGMHQLPLVDRRQALAEIISPNERVQLAPGKIGADLRFHQAAVEQGMEGTVIKDLNSAYYPGQRTKYWIKVRHVQHSDCVICGFIPKEMMAFQSLLLGQYSTDGQLVYIGHVGSGFNNTMQTALRTVLNKLVQSTTAIANIDHQAAQGALWVKPLLVCTVEHLAWTSDHKLRHPVFRGIRQDKQPQECLLDAI